MIVRWTAWAGLFALAMLAACASDRDPQPTDDPTFYRSMASTGAVVDSATAAKMISGYRANNGLSAVAVDPDLMKLAEAQARAMANRDKLDHNVIRTFPDRLRTSGYDAQIAVENIGAGYHTLAEAFSGWRDSPPHRANMLKSGVTKLGIAAGYAPGTKYKVFWTMILASTEPR